MSETRRCMSCMHVIKQGLDFCPNCGESTDIEQTAPFLPIGTIISDRYLIGKAISSYADGVTYIGLDTLQNTVVDIREFLPLSIVKRGGADMSIRVKVDAQNMYYEYLQSFVMLWRSLMRLHKVSATAAVKDLVVNENLTSYAIIEHVDGITLKEYVASQSNLKRLTWNSAKALVLPLLPTLEELNSLNIIHRCISPETLIVDNNGRLLITGFCIAQLCNAESKPEPHLFDGYAPLEQYGYEYPQGSWSDVYSFTSVLYNVLTGLVPPKASERAVKDQLMIQQDVANTLPAYVIKALFNGLRIMPKERIPSITQLKLELVPPTVVENGDIAKTDKKQPVEKKSETSVPQQEAAQNDEISSAPISDVTAPHTDIKKRKKGSGAVALIVSAIISLIIFAAAFIALYPTVLYKYIDFHPLDEIYTKIAFLPINESTSETSKATDETSLPESTATQYVKVADFEKLSYSSVAQNSVFNSKYKLEYEFKNSKLAKDVIIAQSIESGSEVLQGTVITLTVSLGPEQVMLPNVIGTSYEEAYAKLTGLGFKVTRRELKNVRNEVPGKVYTMSPVAGIEYDYATAITLNVWGKKVQSQTTTAKTNQD